MSGSFTVPKDGVEAPEVLPGSMVVGKIFLIATEFFVLPVLYSRRYKILSSALALYLETCPVAKQNDLFWADVIAEETFMYCQRLRAFKR
jgi:hypothetical protein